MPPISVLIKPVSGLCNMNCDYCFYCDETKKRSVSSYGMMSEETLKNVVRKTILRAEGSIAYAFQGGEPTLRGIDFFEKFIFYQGKYNRNKVRVSNAFQTNGYLINKEWCNFFKENNFLVGVSVDGTPQTHDKYRHDKNGGKTYDRIYLSTKLLDRYQVNYNILTVVNHEVATHVEEIYQNYKMNGWKFQQYIVCLDPLGEKHGRTEYAVTPKEYGQFMIRLFELWYHDLNRGKQPYIRQFDNYIGIILGYMSESCDQRGICGIQNIVEADGSVYPCDFYVLDEYKLGNFNQDQLDGIDKKRKEIGFVSRSLALNLKCKQCIYYTICRGGCQRNRDYNHNTACYENFFCESYMMFFEKCYSKLKEIARNVKV